MTLREYITQNDLYPETPIYGYDWIRFSDLQLDMPVTVLGAVRDGINRAEVVEGDGGIVLVNYHAGSQLYDSRESWLESLADDSKREAERLLENTQPINRQHLPPHLTAAVRRLH